MKEYKETAFHNRRDKYFMPDTNKQGWGSLQGQKTTVSEVENGGTRTITRTPL